MVNRSFRVRTQGGKCWPVQEDGNTCDVSGSWLPWWHTNVAVFRMKSRMLLTLVFTLDDSPLMWWTMATMCWANSSEGLLCNWAFWMCWKMERNSPSFFEDCTRHWDSCRSSAKISEQLKITKDPSILFQTKRLIHSNVTAKCSWKKDLIRTLTRVHFVWENLLWHLFWIPTFLGTGKVSYHS